MPLRTPPLRTLLRKLAWRWDAAVRTLRAELSLLTKGEAPLDSEDRRVLERVVIPELAARDDATRVLFVGSDSYTRHYERLFEGKDYWTLDRDRRKRRYGSRQHVVDSLENLGRHFPAGSLDAILCNGVFGWGLDRREDAEAAFEACWTALHPGGLLVFGWNDRPENRPFPPYELEALRRFERATFEPLGSWRHRIEDESRHVFDFLRKPTRQEARATDEAPG